MHRRGILVAAVAFAIAVPAAHAQGPEMIKAVQDPDMKARLLAQGVEPGGWTPAELAAFQKAEVEKWARVIKTGNIKVD